MEFFGFQEVGEALKAPTNEELPPGRSSARRITPVATSPDSPLYTLKIGEKEDQIEPERELKLKLEVAIVFLQGLKNYQF